MDRAGPAHHPPRPAADADAQPGRRASPAGAAVDGARGAQRACRALLAHQSRDVLGRVSRRRALLGHAGGQHHVRRRRRQHRLPDGRPHSGPRTRRGAGAVAWLERPVRVGRASSASTTCRARSIRPTGCGPAPTTTSRGRASTSSAASSSTQRATSASARCSKARSATRRSTSARCRPTRSACRRDAWQPSWSSTFGLASRLEARALAELRGWDGRMGADSAAASIYQVFRNELVRVRFGEALGDLLPALLGVGPHPLLAEMNAHYFLQTQRIVRVPRAARRRRRRASSASGERRVAVATLRHRRPQTWQWGRLHTLRIEHALSIRKPLGQVVQHPAVPVERRSRDGASRRLSARQAHRRAVRFRRIASSPTAPTGTTACRASPPARAGTAARRTTPTRSTPGAAWRTTRWPSLGPPSPAWRATRSA